jgi:phosphoserine phosphatase RsbU/P
MLLVALCLLQPVTLTPAQLRWDLVNIGVGVFLLAIGFGAISLFFFGSKFRDWSLVFFGLFTILYAVRLLGNRPIIESVFDAPRVFWDYINWAISCLIVLPFGLYLYQLVDGQIRKLFRWVLAIQAAGAILETVAAVFGASLVQLNKANNAVTLATLTGAFVVIAVVRWPARKRDLATRDVRVFLGGFAIWFVFIFQSNLVGLRGVRTDTEFFGFLVFVGCLGYITAHRTLATEERLLAIHKELEIARQIQSATLPRHIPKLPGLEIAARYVPMSAVAGDFYDLLGDGEKHIGVLIADVSGHGIPAALIASMVKVAFAEQSRHIAEPASVLTGLNRALCGKFEEHYVTASYIFVDIENGMMRYGGAGPRRSWSPRVPIPPCAELKKTGRCSGFFRRLPTATPKYNSNLGVAFCCIPTGPSRP